MCTFVRSSRLPHPEIRLNDIDIAVGKPRLRSNYALMQARNQVILCNKGVAHRLGVRSGIMVVVSGGLWGCSGMGYYRQLEMIR